LASGGVEWFIALLRATPSAEITGADHDETAEVYVLHQQVMVMISSLNSAAQHSVCICH
jgi:hypothetical protein